MFLQENTLLLILISLFVLNGNVWVLVPCSLSSGWEHYPHWEPQRKRVSVDIPPSVPTPWIPEDAAGRQG